MIIQEIFANGRNTNIRFSYRRRIIASCLLQKITLANGDDNNKILVTLNLEMYRETNDFIRSPIFNLPKFSLDNQALEDYLYLQVAPFKLKSNVMALKPDNIVDGAPRSIFTAKLDSGYEDFINDVNNYSYLPVGYIKPDHAFAAERQPTYGSVFTNENIDLPSPVVIGSAISADSGPEMTPERQEVINGKPYDVITFEYVYQYEMPTSSLAHLGFVFYCFLDVPRFILDNGGSVAGTSNLIKILNGPVNTSIVLENGLVAQNTYAFYTLDGEKWDGSVHLHTENNKDESDPNNPYFGDGSVGISKGWMTGESHIPGEDQPKLNLTYKPNYMVQDLRSQNTVIQENVLGLDVVDGQRVLNNEQAQNFLLENTINYFISPYQQETRKYLTKIDFISDRNDPNVGSSDRIIAPNLYDNDSEYSRLYVTKDVAGKANGIFMVDFRRLLINNSNIFSLIKTSPKIDENILNASELFDIKVYRDRVDKKPIGQVYENYLNDTLYEHPSQLIASRKEGTLVSKQLFLEPLKNKQVQCFTFTDTSISAEESGNYQYRIELLYKDGTYMYLSDRLLTLKRSYSNIQKYLQLAESGYSVLTNNGKKYNFRPYYRNGKFDDQFVVDAQNYFNPIRPWTIGTDENPHALRVIAELGFLFGLEVVAANSVVDFISGIDPSEGSPQVIRAFLKVISSYIDKVEKLIGLKNKKNCNLTLLQNSALTPVENKFTLPSSALITEHYTFNHPQEIVHAAKNKNIFIDYLSVHNPLENTSPGIISVLSNEFENRCFLELAEMSSDFNDKQFIVGSNAYDTISVQGSFLSTAQDNISNTVYSFLSPSISSITSENYISKFTEGANYQSPNNSLSDLTLDDYEKFFNALINYNNSKQISDDYDSMSNYFSNDKFTQLPDELDESYKEIFDSIGITIHNNAFYKDFFEKPAGAVSKQISAADGNLLPDSPGAFSDYNLEDLLKTHFKNMLFNQTSFFDSPTSQHPASQENFNALAGTEQWGIDFYSQLPNIHKIAYAAQTNFNEDGDFKINGIFQNAAEDENANGYTFVNLNLLSQVEVFDVSGIDDTTPLKDQNNWRLLTLQDLNILTGNTLLCRIRLFNEEFAQGLEIPVINNLFFITQNNDNVTIYDGVQPFKYNIENVQNLQTIVQDLNNMNSKKVQASKKVKGKQLLSGTGVASQTSGVDQQQLASESATTPAMQPSAPLTDPVVPTISEPTQDFAAPTGGTGGMSISSTSGPGGGGGYGGGY